MSALSHNCNHITTVQKCWQRVLVWDSWSALMHLQWRTLELSMDDINLLHGAYAPTEYYSMSILLDYVYLEHMGRAIHVQLIQGHKLAYSAFTHRCAYWCGSKMTRALPGDCCTVVHMQPIDTFAKFCRGKMFSGILSIYWTVGYMHHICVSPEVVLTFF